jgi:NADPH2:quinone reductase
VRRDPAEHAVNMRQLAQWFAAGKVRPAITERVPLSGAADAIARMANRQVKGKVVILPDA